MGTKNLNIKKYLFILSAVLFGGIFLFLLLHNVFHVIQDDLDDSKQNERNRIEISEVIIENILLIEKDYYSLFLTNNEFTKEIVSENIQKSFASIYNAIEVLEKGGLFSIVTKINFENKSEFTEFIEYYPKKEVFTLEAIELKPKLKEIKNLLEEIKVLSRKRDFLISSKNNYSELEKVKGEIFHFSRKTTSYFERLREDANRALYLGMTKLENINSEIEETKADYKVLEQSLLFSLVLLMAFLSYKTIKEINSINKVLIKNKQEIKTSLEELEQTNAQLTQEIVEKRLAEESLNISEHRLQTMWNSIHSGVFLIRKDNGVIVDCNPAAEKLINLPSKNIKGANINNFIVSADGGEVQFIEDESNNDKNSDSFVVEANGGIIPILKTEVTIELNALEYWLMSFTDISILKEAEKALLKSKEQAESADKLKSIFIAQMSHEIRTPINIMLSMTSLLEMETSDQLEDEQKSYFGLIARAGNRITRTIDLLINLSEIQAGTYHPIIKSFDLYSDVLSGLLMEYKRRAIDKNINLVINFNSEDAQLRGDQYTVDQIFRQLLDNAIIFTEIGGISITIFRNNYERLVVEIEDTGVGISKEYFDKIFTPFTQEEMGYTRKFDGNGIGLSLVKSYCELNNAIIEVESEKGVGSIFRVTFN